MDRTPRKLRPHAALSRSTIAVLLLALAALLAPPARSQDNILTGTSTGVTSIRIAVADFKPLAADPQTAAFKLTFDATLYADLASAGIFDIVSKGLMPPGSPGTPAEVLLQSYSNAPASAAMLVFGSLGAGRRQAAGQRLSLRTSRTSSTPRSSPSSTARPPAKTPPARSPTASPTRSSTAWAGAPPASPRQKSTTSR